MNDKESDEILEILRDKPQMVWGTSNHKFTSLFAFLTGYRLGFHASSAKGISPELLVPHDFAEFAARELGKPRAAGKDWASYILESTQSEEEAFKLFFNLRQKYTSQKR